MQRRRRRWRYGLAAVGLVGALAVFGAALPHVWRVAASRPRHPMEGLATATVRRGDLWVSVTAAGRVQSAEQTLIECELESLDAGLRGARMYAGGASTILKLIPDGTAVKKGDILCVLDSSEYEELVRQQEMTVERAKADFLQSKLDLEVAKMAVEEYRDGMRIEALKQLDGRIALSKSELERSTDRLEWSRRMLEKGYSSLGQVSNETLAQQRAIFNFEQSRVNADVYRRYLVPRTLRELDNAVQSCQAGYDYQESRLRRHSARLESFKRQVELCTIRAPHDGFVIYANDPYRQIVIEEGMTVRQKQDLFYLPDLAKMEVQALLHESVVDQVRQGMRAKIRIEALPDRVLEGHILSVASVPTRNYFSEVTYYAGLIKVDTIPKGLLPGMTADVEIGTGHRSDVLTVPADAVAVEDGQEVCYVAEAGSLQRREVKVGAAGRDLVEVTGGLSEGEQVVLDPTSASTSGAVVADATPAAESEPAASAAPEAESADTH